MNYQRTPCRCKKCFKRKTLKRHPDHYIIVPACSCGSRSWYIDDYRIKVEYKQWRENCCDCVGYDFPHRKTSGWCVHGKKFNHNNYGEWLDNQSQF